MSSPALSRSFIPASAPPYAWPKEEEDDGEKVVGEDEIDGGDENATDDEDDEDNDDEETHHGEASDMESDEGSRSKVLMTKNTKKVKKVLSSTNGQPQQQERQRQQQILRQEVDNNNNKHRYYFPPTNGPLGAGFAYLQKELLLRSTCSGGGASGSAGRSRRNVLSPEAKSLLLQLVSPTSTSSSSLSTTASPLALTKPTNVSNKNTKQRQDGQDHDEESDSGGVNNHRAKSVSADAAVLPVTGKLIPLIHNAPAPPKLLSDCVNLLSYYNLENHHLNPYDHIDHCDTSVTTNNGLSNSSPFLVRRHHCRLNLVAGAVVKQGSTKSSRRSVRSVRTVLDHVISNSNSSSTSKTGISTSSTTSPIMIDEKDVLKRARAGEISLFGSILCALEQYYKEANSLAAAGFTSDATPPSTATNTSPVSDNMNASAITAGNVPTRYILKLCAFAVNPAGTPGCLDAREMVMAALHFLCHTEPTLSKPTQDSLSSRHHTAGRKSFITRTLKPPLLRPLTITNDLERRSYRKSHDWKLHDLLRIDSGIVELESFFYDACLSYQWLARDRFCSKKTLSASSSSNSKTTANVSTVASSASAPIKASTGTSKDTIAGVSGTNSDAKGDDLDDNSELLYRLYLKGEDIRSKKNTSSKGTATSSSTFSSSLQKSINKNIKNQSSKSESSGGNNNNKNQKNNGNTSNSSNFNNLNKTDSYSNNQPDVNKKRKISLVNTIKAETTNNDNNKSNKIKIEPNSSNDDNSDIDDNDDDNDEYSNAMTSKKFKTEITSRVGSNKSNSAAHNTESSSSNNNSRQSIDNSRIKSQNDRQIMTKEGILKRKSTATNKIPTIKQEKHEISNKNKIRSNHSNDYDDDDDDENTSIRSKSTESSGSVGNHQDHVNSFVGISMIQKQSKVEQRHDEDDDEDDDDDDDEENGDDSHGNNNAYRPNRTIATTYKSNKNDNTVHNRNQTDENDSDAEKDDSDNHNTPKDEDDDDESLMAHYNSGGVLANVRPDDNDDATSSSAQDVESVDDTVSTET